MNLFKNFHLPVFARRCAYCGRVIASDRLSCAKCENSLPRISGEICTCCGREKEECACKGKTYFSAIVAPFYFKDNVRNGIHTYKFRFAAQNHEAYCDEMAQTVKKHYADRRFDFIAFVPSVSMSTDEKGFDHVALLANGLGERLGIRVNNSVLTKLYDTDKQHRLPFYMRKGNLTGVFEVTDPKAVEGKCILLCDDVSTSGETLNECAKMLWLHGAKEICCVTVALTQTKKK